jgi:hypothetical protein
MELTVSLAQLWELREGETGEANSNSHLSMANSVTKTGP